MLLVLRYKTELITTIILLSYLHVSGGATVSLIHIPQEEMRFWLSDELKSHTDLSVTVYNAHITTRHSVFGVALLGARMFDDLF